MDKTIKTLTEVLQESKKEGTTPYDTTAEVVRIEGKTAWVHIPGGIDETPVSMTIDARAGDIVQVRVSGGRAWITGNASAPPTDDKKATAAQKSADKAKITADDAKVTADNAESLATKANRAAQNVNQYFWHTETDTGAGAGAHITEVTQEEFLDDPDNGGGNLLAQSGGIFIRDGLTEIASFSNVYGEGLLTLQDRDACILGGYYDTNAGSAMTRYQVIVPNSNPRISSTFGMNANASRSFVEMSATDNNDSNSLTLDSSKLETHGSIYLKNPKYIYSENTSGDARSIIGINSSNQLVIGYGLYANSEGTTYLEGNNVQILSKNDVKASNAGGTAHCVGTMDTMTTTQHSTSTGSVAATTDSGDKTATFTKAGYYPLGIVGINMEGTNRMYQNIYEYRLSARSSGSATLTYRFRNGSSAAFSGTLYVDILWIKI